MSAELLSSETFTSNNRLSIQLSGDQVRFIRNILGESRSVFARRFGVLEAVIYRIEGKKEEMQDGPLVILVKQVAEQYEIQIPDKPLTRDNVKEASE